MVVPSVTGEHAAVQPVTSVVSWLGSSVTLARGCMRQDGRLLWWRGICSRCRRSGSGRGSWLIDVLVVNEVEAATLFNCAVDNLDDATSADQAALSTGEREYAEGWDADVPGDDRNS